MSRPLRVVLFAGGGGADRGIEAALGSGAVDIAINHSETAIAVHKLNFPLATHHTTNVWDVEPMEATGGRPVELLWASPDCTHFSVAKGGKPREQGIRSLAWVVVAWAKRTRPRVIFLENVREFLGWGPLGDDGRPDPTRKGKTFRQWKAELERLGYAVEHRVLDASEYGAPTKRLRLFVVARCDGQPVEWPETTHGPGKLPLRTAAECIDWSLPCPSIFLTREQARTVGVNRPLAEKTLARIAEGIRRFVLENPQPFIVGCGGRAGQTPPTPADAPLGTLTAKNDRCVVMPTLVQTGYGERPTQRPRWLDIHQPLGTVMATGTKHALVSAFLAKHYGGVTGVPFDGRPLDTIIAQDHHALVTASLDAAPDRREQVRAFLTSYYGEDATSGQAVDAPMRTITAKARMGLVTVAGVEHVITDIGMRMLEPRELLRAQFGPYADGYDMSAATSKAAQVRLIGNSVCPQVAEALVHANLKPRSERRAA